MKDRGRLLLAMSALSAAGATVCAWGQQIRIGIVGGTNLTRDFHTANDTYAVSDPDHPSYLLDVLFFSRSRGVIVGPMAEWLLPRRFSLEADALRRDLRSTQVVTSRFPDGMRVSYTDQFVSVKTWEFPLLLKYALPVSRVRPFVEFGPSFRTWQEPLAVEPSHYGVTAGLGTEFSRGRVRFAPVLRYTRWASDGGFPRRPTNSDQVELLGSFSLDTDPQIRKVAGKRLWLGVMGGTSITGSFHVGTFSAAQVESRAFVAGLSVEMELSPSFSLEVDGLYRPLHAEIRGSAPNGSTFRSPFTVLTWQIPVLGKQRLFNSGLAPFVEGGPALRLSGNTNGYSPSRWGVSAGAGVESRLRAVKVAPRLRYTRWARDRFAYRTPRYDDSRTASNQVELLAGFSF